MPSLLPWVVFGPLFGCYERHSLAEPDPPKQAFRIVEEWIARPARRPILAALAIENGAILASTDQGFRRFPQLRWLNPLNR